MSHEQAARKKHRAGNSCAAAVYTVFSDVNPNMGKTPAPRSEGGKCGAVLAAEKILRDLGLDLTQEFDARFTEEFRSLKCDELLRSGRSCNDFVGAAASIVDSLTGRKD